MVTSYTQQVQQQGKCPHGFPIGACPICSGMSGGGVKDKNKPRKPGEMSYNECLAEWHKIQAKNEAKMQDKLDKIDAAKQALSESKLLNAIDKAQKFLDNAMQKLNTMTSVIKAPVQFIIKNIIQPVVNFISQLPAAIKNIQTFFENTRLFITSVSEKLASVFGEIKNFIDDKVTKNYKKALKTLLSLFTSEENEESEEAKKVKDRELKKILKSLFRIRHKEAKEENDNKSV